MLHLFNTLVFWSFYMTHLWCLSCLVFPKFLDLRFTSIIYFWKDLVVSTSNSSIPLSSLPFGIPIVHNGIVILEVLLLKLQIKHICPLSSLLLNIWGYFLVETDKYEKKNIENEKLKFLFFHRLYDCIPQNSKKAM